MCGQSGREEEFRSSRSLSPHPAGHVAGQQVGEQRPSEPAGSWEPGATASAACAVRSKADGGSTGLTDFNLPRRSDHERTVEIRHATGSGDRP